MPSATAADSSDSMAPSIAIVNAAGTSVTSAIERNVRHGEVRQPARDLAERAGDGRNATEMEHRLDRRGDEHRDQRTWNARQAWHARSVDREQQAQQREQRGGGVQLGQGLQQLPQLLMKVRAARPPAGQRSPSIVRPR